jgi:hypothetical protein
MDRAQVTIFSSVLQTVHKNIGAEKLELGRRKRGQERGYMKTTDVSLRKCEILGLSALKAAESKVLASLESSS